MNCPYSMLINKFLYLDSLKIAILIFCTYERKVLAKIAAWVRSRTFK